MVMLAFYFFDRGCLCDRQICLMFPPCSWTFFSVVFGGLGDFFPVDVVWSSNFRWRLVPERSFIMTYPCFDGGVFCYCSGELFMGLISVVFWGLGGLFLLGVVEPSTFG